MQHRHSFITQQQAKSKIIGQFHRIQQITDKPELISEAVNEFIPIAKHLKYKNNEILRAILHMVRQKTNIQTWMSIYKKSKIGFNLAGILSLGEARNSPIWIRV